MAPTYITNTVSSTTTDSTWFGWCNSTFSNLTTTASTMTSTVGDDIYRMWVNGCLVEVPKQSQEELDRVQQAYREQEEKYKQERLKREEDRRLAQEKAELLLVQHLNKKQKKAYEENRCIPVDGQSGKKYIIRKGRAKNIDVLKEDGTVDYRLCVHPQEQVPDEDTMLAQKLFLEHNEEYLISIANRHQAY